MSLPQENFERAVESGRDSLFVIGATFTGTPDAPPMQLERQGTERLRQWLWDLEAIGAAIRLELMNRETEQPIDFGAAHE